MDTITATLQKDLREFIELLLSERVEFLIVGAHAVAFHGHPRLTGDLDLLFRTTPENAAKLELVCAAFGFVGPPFVAAEFLRLGQIFQLGRVPNRIDLLNSISGVETEQAWANREAGEISELSVFYISKADLIQNKLAAGRGKDLLDVEILSRRH